MVDAVASSLRMSIGVESRFQLPELLTIDSYQIVPYASNQPCLVCQVAGLKKHILSNDWPKKLNF